MPSDKYIDLSVGTSGSNYTAPANGIMFGVCGGVFFLFCSAYYKLGNKLPDILDFIGYCCYNDYRIEILDQKKRRDKAL